MFTSGPAGSRPEEDNAKHVFVALLLIAGVALAAGIINVKIAAGR